ncbi:hypothetical protein GIB67_010259 [Kingdonia uniflora]|uniref:Methyltransferase domain-containing protein n=1 Tax=Kingdonia uniflora TaxID=39325 RepID=A0A7J7NAJ5_9MAGN|nr:hypothetical protein GIB67_010259 [Kingdonia uniflora]
MDLEQMMDLSYTLVSVMNNVNTSVGNTSVGEKEYTLAGKSTITEILRGVTFQISANSFFQTNTHQAEVLYKLIEECAGLRGDGSEVVLDLFCGTGTIGLTLAKRVKHVYGYEVVPQAISDACRNAEQNGIHNATFVQGDLNKISASFGDAFPKPDIVISGVSSAARAKFEFKLVRVSWYQSDLVESNPIAMAEGPNATDPAQVLAPHVGGPSVNPRPLNTRTRLDQLEEKMQALSGIIDQVTTLEERLDGFSDDQAHMGERLVTLEGVVKGNMATLLDQVAELSSKSSSQSQQRTGSSNNYNKGKNGGCQARSGGDQGHGQNRSGGASTGGASSSNSGREYHRPRNNGGASSSSRFQGRPGNLKCFLCGGNHKAYQCP